MLYCQVSSVDRLNVARLSVVFLLFFSISHFISITLLAVAKSCLVLQRVIKSQEGREKTWRVVKDRQASSRAVMDRQGRQRSSRVIQGHEGSMWVMGFHQTVVAYPQVYQMNVMFPLTCFFSDNHKSLLSFVKSLQGLSKVNLDRQESLEVVTAVKSRQRSWRNDLCHDA